MTLSRNDLVTQWRATFATLGVCFTPAPVVPIGETLRFRADFYLPASRQRVVVMPRALDAFDRLIQVRAVCVMAPRNVGSDNFDIPLVVAGPGGLLSGWRGECMQDGPSAKDLGFYRCAECEQWYFLDHTGGWACQCCGFYDGSNTTIAEFNDRGDGLRIWPFPVASSAGAA